MSNEMNLYKRCKNIFKTHGVDMGGGSGGNFVVHIEGDAERITADKSFAEIKDQLMAGNLAILVGKFMGHDIVCTSASMFPNQENPDVCLIMWILGASGVIQLASNGEEEEWHIG